MKKYITVLSMLLMGAIPMSVNADDGIKSHDLLEQEIQLTRAILEADRKSLVSQSLQLSYEATAFWKVYNDYRAKMIKVNKRRTEIVTDYADALRNNNLSDKDAIKLLTRSLNVEQDQVKVKKAFVNKFKKVLPAKLVGRFYQVDRRLDLLVSAKIAQAVPLMEENKERSQ